MKTTGIVNKRVMDLGLQQLQDALSGKAGEAMRTLRENLTKILKNGKLPAALSAALEPIFSPDLYRTLSFEEGASCTITCQSLQEPWVQPSVSEENEETVESIQRLAQEIADAKTLHPTRDSLGSSRCERRGPIASSSSALLTTHHQS